MPDFSGAAVVTPHTVLLAGNPQYPQQAQAAAAITPGHLVELTSTGTIQKHSTASGNALPAFALENVTPDRTVATQAIDTPYAVGETVKWMVARPGELVYAWLPISAAAIVTGDFLVSNGDGSLKKGANQAVNESGSATYTVFARAIVAQAAESVNNSANTTTAVRIRVRVV